MSKRKEPSSAAEAKNEKPQKKAKKKEKMPEIKVKVVDLPSFDWSHLESREARRAVMAQAFDYLQENDVVRLGALASPTDVGKAIGLFWDFMESLDSGIDRKDPKTWSNENWPGLFSVALVKTYGAGQSAFMWFLRTLPRVREWFEYYHERITTAASETKGDSKQERAPDVAKESSNNKRLVVSTDSFSVIRGGDQLFDPNRSWLHIDQNLRLLPNQNASVQLGIQLLDCTDPHATGSFLCLPGLVKTLLQRFQAGEELERNMFASSGHYLPFAANHPFYQMVASVLRFVAGDGVCWKSLCPHQNFLPTKATVCGRLRRLTGFVTMADLDCPVASSSFITSAAQLQLFRKQRREAAAQGWTTSHWPLAKPRNNTLPRPRHKNHKPLCVPASCKRAAFSPEQEALLLGL